VDIVVLDCNILRGGEVREKRLRRLLFCDVCEERFSGGSERCSMTYGRGGRAGNHGKRKTRCMMLSDLGLSSKWPLGQNFID